MRLLFEKGGQTGVTRLEHLADALTSRPHANTGALFVNHDQGQGLILLKSDEALTALIQANDPEALAKKLWQEARETEPKARRS